MTFPSVASAVSCKKKISHHEHKLLFLNSYKDLAAKRPQALTFGRVMVVSNKGKGRRRTKITIIARINISQLCTGRYRLKSKIFKFWKIFITRERIQSQRV